MGDLKIVPVTVLSGFLGAGKTSVLAHTLTNRGELRIGIIVNDLAEVNVDARFLHQLNAGLSIENFAELHAGCVCCDAGQDLLGSIRKLLGSSPDLDHIIVECSGVAQLQNVHRIFLDAAARHLPLSAQAPLNSLVTVVDAGTILTWLDTANGRAPGGTADLDPATGQLLIAQIEGADLIILNKADRVSPSQLRECSATLSALNPKADLQLARFGVVPQPVLLAPRSNGRQVAPFQGGKGDQISHPSGEGDEVRPPPRRHASKYGWGLSPMRHTSRGHVAQPGGTRTHSHPRGDGHGHGHDGEKSDSATCGTDESDSVPENPISSFVFGGGGGRPFHPRRLADVVRSARKELKGRQWAAGKTFLTGVLRSKGLLWLATCMSHAREWVIAGNVIEVQPGAIWDQRGPRQELVFIGTIVMDEGAIRSTLEACLLTAQEMEGGSSSWTRLTDPLILTLTTGHGPRLPQNLKSMEALALVATLTRKPWIELACSMSPP